MPFSIIQITNVNYDIWVYSVSLDVFVTQTNDIDFVCKKPTF